ncbi:hypothetical protein, partial [Duncaniella muris]|uniref:hypothetical protein n=1 Tax=Duncaniella muris TaxID=2094150 RepID=UPI0025A55BA1
MKEQDLKSKASILLGHFHDNGYSKYTIDLFRLAINYALRLRSVHPGISYEDIYRSKVDADPNHRPLHHWRRLFATIEHFDRTGILPGHGNTPSGGEKKYDTL